MIVPRAVGSQERFSSLHSGLGGEEGAAIQGFPQGAAAPGTRRKRGLCGALQTTVLGTEGRLGPKASVCGPSALIKGSREPRAWGTGTSTPPSVSPCSPGEPWGRELLPSCSLTVSPSPFLTESSATFLVAAGGRALHGISSGKHLSRRGGAEPQDRPPVPGWSACIPSLQRWSVEAGVAGALSQCWGGGWCMGQRGSPWSPL